MIRVSEMNLSYHTDSRINQTEMNSSHLALNNSFYDYTGPLMPFLQYHPAHLIPLLFASCLGLITNTISAMVWFAKVKSKSGAFFLGCLSGVDAFFCLSMAVVKCTEIADNFTCTIYIVIAIATSLANTSRLLTLPIVAHRWVAISRPLTVTRVFPLHRQIKVQACLVISLLPICGLLIYVYVVECDATHYSDFILYLHIISYSWNALITICLLILNTLLLTAACRMKKIAPSHVTGNWQNRVEHRMTVIVLFMSTFSLLDNMIDFMYLFDMVNIAEFDDILFYNIMNIISQWSLIFNSSINFVFYVCFAKDFRLTLLSMCKSVANRIAGDHTHGQEQ